MGIINSDSSPEGTHPSRASSCTHIKCDNCGEQFTADSNIDGDWQLHGENVGATIHGLAPSEPNQELCLTCVQNAFGDD